MNTVIVTNEFLKDGLYDPIQRKIRPVLYIKNNYGQKIFEQLEKETKDARRKIRLSPDEAFSKNLLDTMWKKCLTKYPGCGIAPEKPLDEKAREAFQSTFAVAIPSQSDKIPEEVASETNIQRQRQKGDDFFLMLERGLFRNPEFRKIFKSPFTVYAWLWSNIVRKGWKDKKGYPIKAVYYDHNLLAYCSSFSKIAKECFMDKDTVRKYIDFLEENGIIKVHFIIPEGRKLPQGVYVLGEWKEIDGEPKEKLYLEQVLLSAKEGDSWYF